MTEQTGKQETTSEEVVVETHYEITSYMALSGGGNAICAWDTENDAREWITTTLEREPGSLADVVVVEFDGNGMAQRAIYPEDTP